MEGQGVISKVEEPSEWCSGMVVVPKPNGSIRICVGLSKLNECVERERYILPAVEHTLGQLADAKVFSKLDANSGFYQIQLNEESSEFMRLLLRISSAPEIYQKIMSRILEGTIGVVCQMDDILVFGKTVEEHDSRLREVMKRLKVAGLTLNREKCEFRTTEVNFLGRRIDSLGIHPSDDKVAAIVGMPVPTEILQKFSNFLFFMISDQAIFFGDRYINCKMNIR